MHAIVLEDLEDGDGVHFGAGRVDEVVELLALQQAHEVGDELAVEGLHTQHGYAYDWRELSRSSPVFILPPASPILAWSMSVCASPESVSSSCFMQSSTKPVSRCGGVIERRSPGMA